MARARNIKPGFWTNEHIVELDPWARLLYIGLWAVADREGRLEDRPKRIKMEVFPADVVDVDALLGDIEEQGLIRRYSVNGSNYIWIPGFREHQNPHKNEKSSELPPHSDDVIAPLLEDSSNGAINPAETLNLNSDSPKPDTGFQKPAASASSVPKPKPAKPKVDPPQRSVPDGTAEVGEHPFTLFEAMCEQLGVHVDDIPSRDKSKQLAAAKRLAHDGMTSADMTRMTRWLKSQEWRTGGIDMYLVEKERVKWVTEGKPENAKPGSSARTATHKPNQAAILIEQARREREADEKARSDRSSGSAEFRMAGEGDHRGTAASLPLGTVRRTG